MKKKGLTELTWLKVDGIEKKEIMSIPSEYVISSCTEQGYLIVKFFQRKYLDAHMGYADIVVYIKDDDYISLKLEDGQYKWLTGCLKNILEYTYVYQYDFGYHMQADKEIINTYLGKDEDPLKNIFEFQKEVMDKRYCEKLKRVTDKFDKQMEIVPNILEDFTEWVDNEPLKFSRYLIYKRDKKTINAFCTYCGNEIELQEAKHNEQGICPCCGTNATYKADGKAKRLYDDISCTLLQKVTYVDGKHGILVRYFDVVRDLYGEKRFHPSTSIMEVGREFYKESRTVRVYSFSNFRQHGFRWNDENIVHSTYGALYPDNIKEELRGTIWQYSAIDVLAKSNRYFRLSSYLKFYPEKPAIEYLIKVGLTKLADEFICSWGNKAYPNLKAKKIKEVLGISMEVLPQLIRVNADEKVLEIAKEAYELGIRLTDEQLKWCESNLMYTDRLKTIIHYTTLYKAIKYLQSQCKTYEHKNLSIRDWFDYLHMCEQLEYDMKNSFIIFPRDLKKAHDEANKLVEYKQNKVHDKAIKKRSKETEQLFGFKDKHFMIMIPKSAKSLMNESAELRHCVKSYIDKVALGKTNILFVRQINKPNKPFYTLEVKDGEVIQCRGYSNADMTPEVKRFIEKFKNAKLIKLHKEVKSA